jgi:hypothetical protein
MPLAVVRHRYPDNCSKFCLVESRWMSGAVHVIPKIFSHSFDRRDRNGRGTSDASAWNASDFGCVPSFFSTNFPPNKLIFAPCCPHHPTAATIRNSYLRTRPTVLYTCKTIHKREGFLFEPGRIDTRRVFVLQSTSSPVSSSCQSEAPTDCVSLDRSSQRRTAPHSPLVPLPPPPLRRF